jgi:hypothetical protein
LLKETGGDPFRSRLSITHDIIVKQHSGSIEVDTQLGEFPEVRIIVPRTRRSSLNLVDGPNAALNYVRFLLPNDLSACVRLSVLPVQNA